MEEPKSKAKRGAKTAAAAQEDKITLLPLSELHDFPNHPFKVRDDEAMQELREDLQVILAKAVCKNISKEEVHQLVDEIYSNYADET